MLGTVKNSALNAVFPITLRSQFPSLGEEKIVIRISFVIDFLHLIVDFNILWYAACNTFQTLVYLFVNILLKSASRPIKNTLKA